MTKISKNNQTLMALEETRNHTSSQVKTTKCAGKRSFLMTLIAKTTKMMRPTEMTSKNSKIIIVNLLPTVDNFSKLKKKTEEMKISVQIWSSRCFIRKTLYRDRLKDRALRNSPLKILRQATTWAAILRWNNYWPKKVSNSRKKLKDITRKMNVQLK